MKCIKCEGIKWKTLETRQDTQNYDQVCVLRRKQCLGCGHRIWTIEQLLREIERVKPERKQYIRKVKDPKPQEAKSKMKKRVQAMMKMESRRDAKTGYDDYFGPENDYLNRW